MGKRMAAYGREKSRWQGEEAGRQVAAATAAGQGSDAVGLAAMTVAAARLSCVGAAAGVGCRRAAGTTRPHADQQRSPRRTKKQCGE